jgi:2,4-dienoyl-CoA reductase-like NADH-dependent reductase (Old Yellow Enzyme family)
VCAGAVQSGRATFAGVGRNAFAYPDWVRDLMDRGHIDPKKTCIACSGCSQIMRSGESTGCVVRDREVYAPRRGRPPGKGAES